MTQIEQITDWIGQEVFDSAGESLGKLEDVFFAAGSTEAQLGLVKSGLLGRKQKLVPLQGATVGRDYVRVAFTSEQIDQAAGAAEVEAGERVGSADAQAVGSAFGVELAAGELDSGTALEERRRQAEDAEERAAKLEAEAHARAGAAEDVAARAQEESAEAAAAREAAEAARAEADRLRS